MTEQNRLHGQWNETGTRRWCADCAVWVRLEDWEDHKREEAKLATDGGRVQDTEGLRRFSEGDTIVVSERETPMEVASVEARDPSGVDLIAMNHYGEYRLREYANGEVSLMVSGYVDSVGVEVNHAE